LIEPLIKALLLVPSSVLIFYGTLYSVLAELNLRTGLNKFYRVAGIVLLVIGILLLIIYSVI
jgi:hypothetical protein